MCHFEMLVIGEIVRGLYRRQVDLSVGVGIVVEIVWKTRGDIGMIRGMFRLLSFLIEADRKRFDASTWLEGGVLSPGELL